MTAPADNPILIVEDNEDLRQIMRIHCERSGFNVIEARNADEAILRMDARKRTKEPRISVVVSDIQMPGRSGIDLAKEILLRDDVCPVILITGFSENYEQETIDANVYAVIEKPFNFLELIATIKSAMDL